MIESQVLRAGPLSLNSRKPFAVEFELDGERIKSARLEFGFAFKDLEKSMCRQDWRGAVVLSAQVDPDMPVFYERVTCEALESSLSNLKISPRARTIREALCSLVTVSGILQYLMEVGRSAGADTFVKHVSRDRERVIDQIELLTGSRFGKGFIVLGGVAADVTEGFIERVLELCEYLKFRTKEYNDLLTYNRMFSKRLQGVGTVSESQLKLAESSVNSKLNQEFIGDAHDRFVSQLKNLINTIRNLRNQLEQLPLGSTRESDVLKSIGVSAKRPVASVSNYRGEIRCEMDLGSRSDGPSSIRFTTPSTGMAKLLEIVLTGERVQDFEVVFASLGISIPEVDR